MTKYKKNSISLTLQKLNMIENYPDWEIKINKDKLTCIGIIKPTDFSSEFKIKLEYRLGCNPIIDVLDPKLKGKNIPHLYKENHLCVYHPPSQDWNPKKYISNTLIPFTASWLYFYEIWLFTGVWEGGGIHKNKKQ